MPRSHAGRRFSRRGRARGASGWTFRRRPWTVDRLPVPMRSRGWLDTQILVLYMLKADLPKARIIHCILALTLSPLSLGFRLLAGQKGSMPSPELSISIQHGIDDLQRHNYADARREFSLLTQSDPESAAGFFYLGISEMALGNHSAAEKALRRALELNPQSENTLYNLGTLLLDEKRPRESIRYFEEASRLDPGSPEPAINAIRACLEAGQVPAAEQLAESGARRFTSMPEFHLEVGKSFLQHGLNEQARASLERADHLAPHEPEIVFPLADAYLRERNPSAALLSLQSSPPEAKSLAPYHYLLAQSCYQEGKAQEAMEEITLAGQIDTGNPIYLLTAGRYDQKYGRQQEALNVLKKAEVLAPRLAEIPYSIAVSFFILEKYDETVNYVERALHLEPDFDRALFLLGITRFAQIRPAEAEASLAHAVRLNPQNPYFECFYGMVLYSEGRIPDAQEHFNKAVVLNPSYALAHYQLGRLHARIGKYPEASNELERAVALQPDLNEAYYQLGHVYIRLGEKGKADEALAKFEKYRGTEYSERQEFLHQMHAVVVEGP
jgi:protein O-GlcNAc transferase